MLVPVPRDAEGNSMVEPPAPDRGDAPRLPWWRRPAVRGLAEGLVVCAVAMLVAAQQVGGLLQDASWDLLNYHWYNPWALLHGRLGWDIAPAMRQTYFNPLPDVPFYLLATHVSPIRATQALAAFQALLAAGVYALAMAMLAPAAWPWWLKRVAAGALAVAGATSPLMIYELGFSAADNTTGVLVLAGLLCVLLPMRASGRAWLGWVALGGLLCGMAVGFKQTNGPFAIGLAAATLFAGRGRTSWWKSLPTLGLAGLAGTLLAGGWWWWQVYQLTGNPLFPQLNHVFESPWVAHDPFVDEVSKAPTTTRTLLYPWFYNALFGTTAGGRQFYDLRLPILYVLFAGAAVAWAVRRLRRQPVRRELTLHASLVAFVVVSYAGWLAVFQIARYVTLIEVLAPVVVVACVATMRLPRVASIAVVSMSVLAMVATYRTMPPMRVYWTDSMFDVELPEPAEAYEGALIVIAGDSPLGFVAPSFPASARFIRIDGNLYYMDPTREARFDREIGDLLRSAIAEHEGPMFLMSSAEDEPASIEADADFFDLTRTGEPSEIQVKVGPPVVLQPLRLDD